jgi:general secretion pathway protein I
LVEALVALAVFALAGVALIQLQTQSARTLSATETRTLATLAAQNRLVELTAARDVAPIGETRGEDMFAGRTWLWRVVAVAVGDGGARRVSVTVSDKAGGGVAESHGFIAVEPGGGGS